MRRPCTHFSMPSPDYDLLYLHAAADELKTYLLSDELFWPLTLRPQRGEPPYPQFTLGNLLLARKRLGGRRLDSRQQSDLTEYYNSIEAVKKEWQTAWEKKARREFSSRLRQWNQYLGEISNRPENHIASYPSQARLRAILDLLKDDLYLRASSELGLLAKLDTRLRGLLSPGAFIWEKELASAFPKGEYWYLWGHLSNAPR